MGMGLEIYNANGVKTFASGDYLPRYLGSFQTGGSAGSISDGNLTDGTGTPFVLYFPIVPPSSYNAGFPASGWSNPIFTISGTTISWSFDSSVGPGNGNNCLVIYGLR